MNRNMKIAILGGTFNPPHVGHLMIADTVASALNYDKVIFIPTKKPPHKNACNLASSEDRINMLKLATQNDDRFEVEDFEIKDEVNELSYTINTLKYLYKKYEGIVEGKMGLIIGADLLADFPKWNSVEVIAHISDIIVLNREGDNNLVESVISKYKMKVLKMNRVDLSSSIIRDNIENGVSIRYRVNDLVYEYIKQKRLYTRN